MHIKITPLSPKWRLAIERRIADERQLTMMAVGRGVRIKPGQFWNLSGTFLFTVYVMTALGFGAPVPHTLWGRTSALVYAFFAVPLHIYLMVNASTVVTVRIEEYVRYLNRQRVTAVNSESRVDKESPNCSRNCEEPLKSFKEPKLRECIDRMMRAICICRCILLAMVVYYVLGVLMFGVLRHRSAADATMFPLEFTTTGGLECVENYVRIAYSFYVEGAMCLLACALATLRRHSSTVFSSLMDHYRLFVSGNTNENL